MTEPINRNSATPYFSTLVPGFTNGLKYAVVAGASCGLPHGRRVDGILDPVELDLNKNGDLKKYPYLNGGLT